MMPADYSTAIRSQRLGNRYDPRQDRLDVSEASLDIVGDSVVLSWCFSDGFALNVGADSWQPARVADAFTAANTFAPPFYLFFSFDVTSLPCGDANAANTIRSYIAQYAANPAHLKDGAGSAVVSTFAGEYCNFGTGDTNSGWYSAVKAGLPPTTFIPAFFGDPNNFGSYPVMDGDFYVSRSY